MPSGETGEREFYMGESRFKEELERRSDNPEAFFGLISQERAYIEADICFADLPALRYEGTFPEDKKTAATEVLTIKDFLGDRVNELPILRKLEKSNGERLDGLIDQFVRERPEIIRDLKIESTNDLDPAVAATLALRIVSSKMRYASELVPEYYRFLDEGQRAKIDELKTRGEYKQFVATENKKYDEATTDELLLDLKGGVCRHFAEATMGIYERLKVRDGSGRLKDTFFVYKDNQFDPQDVEMHAYNLFVGYRKGFGTMVAVTDPTFYLQTQVPGRTNENFTDLRLTSATQAFQNPELRSKINLPVSELETVLDRYTKRCEREFSTFGSRCDTRLINRLLSAAGQRWEFSGDFENVGAFYASEANHILELASDKENYWEACLMILRSPHIQGLNTQSYEPVSQVVESMSRHQGSPNQTVSAELLGSLKRYREFFDKRSMESESEVVSPFHFGIRVSREKFLSLAQEINRFVNDKHLGQFWPEDKK